MQIQKPSAFSSTLGAGFPKHRVEAERPTQQSNTDDKEARGDLIPTVDRTVVPEPSSDPAKKSGIKIHSVDRQRLFELNPKLDRPTRNAIDAYESMQLQFDVEQRESVSKLLGVDLYV